MRRLLDNELLTNFERALESVGARITHVWAAGISDGEMDRLSAPVDIDLPEEARVWWRWHNGFVPDASPSDWELTPRRPLLDLKTSIEEYESARGAMRQLDGAEARLRPVADQPWIYFDCAGAREEPVPIYISGHAEGHRLVLPSIAELVQHWTRLIETGVFETNQAGSWEWDFERVPPDVAELGIY